MYVADQGGKPVRFIRTRPEIEQTLTDLLSANPNLLADSLSDSVEESERWFEVKAQFSLPDGRGQAIFVDHLYLDQSGTPILVEDKLSGNPESKRKVVAQMIDYAAALEAVTVENLQSQIHPSRQPEFDEFLAGGRADDFWSTVQAKLSAGECRLVFVADEIPVTLRRLIEYLNERLSVQEVVGIELTHFQCGTRVAYVPTVIGRTERAKTQKAAAAAPRTVDDYFRFVASTGRPKVVDVDKGGPALLASLQRLRMWAEGPDSKVQLSTSSASTNPRLIFSRGKSDLSAYMPTAASTCTQAG
ncbi:hypothetical protein [Caballeronia sp. GAWG1-1]|uniref:hypothetical protein n=1 Tax=Caballeronia sp. GAWG1-1 TaxID=2921742 RepID=UPI0020282088|nr:hypothetical protein [Caballeronia sp. GAWG1-1]